MFWSLVVCFMHFAPWVFIHALIMHFTCTLDASCCTHSNTWHVLHFTHASLVFLDLLVHITCSCIYVTPKFISCSIILSMSCSLWFVAFFWCFCLMFELHFLIHLAPLMHHTLTHIFFSFPHSFWLFCLFVTKKGRVY